MNMQKGDYLTTILKSPKSILTLKDILLLWQNVDTNAARVRLTYYVRKGHLFRIRRGLYAKGKEYNKLELATRIFTPSYVTFQTVLLREGVNFQYQSDITIASYLTRTITINNQVFSFRKMKDDILANAVGIDLSHETSIAGKERAILDTLYVNADYHFDNLNSVDWDKIYAILPIYENKRMQKLVDRLNKNSKN